MNSRISTLCWVTQLITLCVGFTTSAAVLDYAETRLPLYIEESFVNDITVRVSPTGGLLWLDSKPITKELATRIDPSVMRAILNDEITDSGRSWVSNESLNKAGLDCRFDELSLEINLYLPAIARKTNTVIVATTNANHLESASLIKSAKFSAFVNTFTAQDFLFTSNDSNKTNSIRQPVRSMLDGAFSLSDWVLEWNGQISEKLPHWQRNSTRLVRDLPSQMLRLSAGDIVYPVSGFQSYQPIGGAAVVSAFSLQPYRLTVPSGRHELNLKRDSTIKIWMNGRLIQTMRLQAGRHDIREFPVSGGINEIMMEIVDDTGNVEIVQVPYLFADLLLAPGIHEVAYTAGFPSREDGVSLAYDVSNPNASISHRYGISERVTAGAYVQTDKSRSIVGTSLGYATPIGAFGIESAATRTKSTTWGFGTKIGYRYTDYLGPEDSTRTFTLELESRFPRFGSSWISAPQTASTHALWMTASQLITRTTVASLAASYRLGEKPHLPSASSRLLSATIGQSWLSGAINANLTLNNTWEPNAKPNPSLFLLLTWALPARNQAMSAAINSQDGGARLQWDYSPGTNLIGGSRLSVSAEKADQTQRFDGSYEYTANRGKLKIAHNAFSAENGSLVHLSSAQVATAAVFAGGKLAISRPVSQGFAIVTKNPSLIDKTIWLNPQDERSYQARSDWLGPAVVTDLTAYRYYPLQVFLPELVPGATLEREFQMLYPKYRSGFQLSVGTDAFVLAKGFIADEDDGTAALWSGVLRFIDDPAWPERVLFTNREGYFSVDGLKPGLYVAESLQPPRNYVFLEIPENTSGIFDAGTLTLARGNTR